MRQVDVYLLDWNGSRPRNMEGVWDAFNTGRYEYSFSLELDPALSPIAACEHAYMRQQDVGFKTRQDRQSMSIGDVVVLDGTAYYCATAGFKEVPGLATQILARIERSWDIWTAETAPPPPDLAGLLRSTLEYMEQADNPELWNEAWAVIEKIEAAPAPALPDARARVAAAERAEARMSREWIVDPEEADVQNPDYLASVGDALRDAEAGN